MAHQALRIPIELLLLDAGLVNTEISPPLGEAARAGMLHIVLAHLHQGREPNERDRKHPKYTPLHRAVSGGHRDVIRLLLCMRASPHARDRLGFSALHFAANQSAEIVADLLHAECEVNAVNLQGITPLHSAAGMGRDDICKLLLNTGAHAISRNVQSPAQFAQRAAERRVGAELEKCLALVEMLKIAEAAQPSGADLQKTWCFRASGEGVDASRESWLPYDADAAASLETARIRGETEIVIVVGGHQYHVNLDRLTQTNIDTGVVRPVSFRQPTSNVESGWTPVAPGHWDGMVSTGAGRELPSGYTQLRPVL